MPAPSALPSAAAAWICPGVRAATGARLRATGQAGEADGPGMTVRLPGPAPGRASRPRIIIECRYLLLQEVAAHGPARGTRLGQLRVLR